VSGAQAAAKEVRMALHVHSVALEAVVALRPVVMQLLRHDRSLGEQLRKAASSMALNIGEAEASDPGNSRARLRSAAGSTAESRAALRLAIAWGYVKPEAVAEADRQLDRVAAMLYRLTAQRR
jgi:four helix bundle protein